MAAISLDMLAGRTRMNHAGSPIQEKLTSILRLLVFGVQFSVFSFNLFSIESLNTEN
jgi:hypothetical protein